MPSRRRTQRGRGSKPRVLVACHVPSLHGTLSWEGHTIVGYVDVLPGAAGEDGVPYYQGWDAVPAELKGTIDIVLSAGCPVVPTIRQGHNPVYDATTYAIVEASLALLRPTGVLMFPRIDRAHPRFLAALTAKGATADILSLPNPRAPSDIVPTLQIRRTTP